MSRWPGGGRRQPGGHRAQARDNLTEALILFFETAGAEEVERRLSGEVYVTPVEVCVGESVSANLG